MTEDQPRTEPEADDPEAVLWLLEYREQHRGRVNVELMGKNDSFGPTYWMASWRDRDTDIYRVRFTAQAMRDELIGLIPPDGQSP